MKQEPTEEQLAAGGVMWGIPIPIFPAMWQFFRFEGTPQLHDQKAGKDRFTIGYFPDPEEAKSAEEYASLRSFDMPHATTMPADFYRVTHPRFAAPPGGLGNNEGYGLELELAGLLRKVWREVQEPGHPNVSHVDHESWGFGDFRDFQRLGAYALDRLPNIAGEVVCEPNAEIDPRDHRYWEWFQEDIRSIDWPAFQAFVIQDFHHQYVGAVQRMVTRFTREQRGELVALVGPLS